MSHTPGFNFSEDIPSLKKDVGDKAIILEQEEREYDLVEDDDGVAYESLYEVNFPSLFTLLRKNLVLYQHQKEIL